MEFMLENTSYQTIDMRDLQTKAGNGCIKNSVNSGLVSIYGFKLGCNFMYQNTKKVGFASLRKSSYFFFVLLTKKMIFGYDEILAFYSKLCNDIAQTALTNLT